MTGEDMRANRPIQARARPHAAGMRPPARMRFREVAGHARRLRRVEGGDRDADGGRALQPVALAGADRPSPRGHVGHRRRLLADRDPHVHPRPPGGLDPARGEGVDERLAAGGVGGGGALAGGPRTRGRSRARATRSCSRWLTHPAPTAWRARTRATVTSSPARTATRRSGPRDFETERTTAHRARRASHTVRAGTPATGPAWSSSTTSAPRVAVEDAPELAGAGGVEGGAGGVLGAGGEDEGLRAGAQHAPRAPRASGPPSSTATGRGTRPSAPTRSSTPV